MGDRVHASRARGSCPATLPTAPSDAVGCLEDLTDADQLSLDRPALVEKRARGCFTAEDVLTGVEGRSS